MLWRWKRFALCVALGVLVSGTQAGILSAEELAEEQVVRVAVGVDDIKTLDPHFSVGTGEWPMTGPVYEGLLSFPDGVVTSEGLEPGLATEWAVDDSGLTWTFKLREGVEWHGGYGAFTAEDVKFSIERVLDKEVASPFAGSFSVIESVMVVDRHTVAVKTRRVEPALPSLLVNSQAGLIVSKKAVESGVDLRTQPVGTGAFQVEEYRPRESVTLVRNESYWGGTPIVEKVVVLFMADNSTRELALRTGDVQAIALPARQDAIDRMREAGMLVDLTAPANMFAIYFNLTQQPLDDLRVRRALAGAIDRDIMVRFLGKDVAMPEVSPLPTGYLGHTDDVPTVPYDPEAARALLAEAGYVDGIDLSMAISNSDIYLPPMQIIQEMWKKIGVNLELNVVDHPTYHRLIRENVNPVVIYGAYRYPLTGTIYLTQFYHSTSAIGTPTASINFSHYGEVIPGVDMEIDKARTELDPKVQVALWEAAQRKIVEDVVSVPLFTRNYAMARSPKLDLGFEQKSWEFYLINEKARLLK